MLIKSACFSLCFCYSWISHPFLVVVFMVYVPAGFRYLGRRDLVAGHLAGIQQELSSVYFILAMIIYVVEYDL